MVNEYLSILKKIYVILREKILMHETKFAAWSKKNFALGQKL